MSKKHQGVQPWYREHMQLGRRKKPGSETAEVEAVTDARKPPGWRGRKATREAATQEKQEKAAAGQPSDPAAVPAVAKAPAAKPVFAKAAGAKHGARNGAPHVAKPAGKPATKTGKPAATVVEATEHKVTLDGEGRPYITLVQFLKTIAAVGTGGSGKHAIRAGGILVNGSEDLRPGRKLHAGDVVTVAGAEHPVTL